MQFNLYSPLLLFSLFLLSSPPLSSAQLDVQRQCTCGALAPLNTVFSPGSGLQFRTLSYDADKGYSDIAVCNIGITTANQQQQFNRPSDTFSFETGLVSVYPPVTLRRRPNDFPGDFKFDFLSEPAVEEKFRFSLGYDCSCNRSLWRISLGGELWAASTIDSSEVKWSAAPGGLSGKCERIQGIGCDGERVEFGQGYCAFGCDEVTLPTNFCQTARLFFPMGTSEGVVPVVIRRGEEEVGEGECDYECMIGPSCPSDCTLPVSGEAVQPGGFGSENFVGFGATNSFSVFLTIKLNSVKTETVQITGLTPQVTIFQLLDAEVSTYSYQPGAYQVIWGGAIIPGDSQDTLGSKGIGADVTVPAECLPEICKYLG